MRGMLSVLGLCSGGGRFWGLGLGMLLGGGALGLWLEGSVGGRGVVSVTLWMGWEGVWIGRWEMEERRVLFRVLFEDDLKLMLALVWCFLVA